MKEWGDQLTVKDPVKQQCSLLKKQMSVVRFCCVVLRRLRDPHVSSNTFCLLGRINLIVMHILEFAGREGLAPYSFCLWLGWLSLRNRLGLGHWCCRGDLACLLTEQFSPQLFKTPPLALITQPLASAESSLCSVGSQLLGLCVEKVWKPFFSFSLWKPIFSQLQSPELLSQGWPKAESWRVNHSFLFPIFTTAFPCLYPFPLPFTISFWVKGPPGHIVASLPCAAQPHLHLPASVQGTPCYTKGTELGSTMWGGSLWRQRWGHQATFIFMSCNWANHFFLRLSFFLCKPVMKLPIYLAQGISRFERDNRWYTN